MAKTLSREHRRYAVRSMMKSAGRFLDVTGRRASSELEMVRKDHVRINDSIAKDFRQVGKELSSSFRKPMVRR